MVYNNTKGYRRKKKIYKQAIRLVGRGLLAIMILVPTAIIVSLNSSTPTVAYSNSRLMDDLVFDRAGSMNEAQIQSFLASKGPCLKSYQDVDFSWNGSSWVYSGSVPVSKIIYKASQQWGLNPQVIIATLEKEESLVSGNSCDGWRYNSAMGYGCPDSGGCNPKYAGLTRQVLWGSWQLKFNKERSIGNVNWGDNGDISYVGYMTKGSFKRCSTCALIYYDGFANIDGQSVNLENGTTASLYTYTPHLGQSFPGIFEKWFGSVHYKPLSSSSRYARSACTIHSYTSEYVGRLYHPETKDYLYTASWQEACTAVSYGYIWDGLVFKSATGTDKIPVYRLANYINHVFTSSPAVRDDYIANKGYHEEGIGFYVYFGVQPNTQPTYCLVKDSTVFYTSSAGEKTYFEQVYGYSYVGTSFYTESLSSQQDVLRLNQNHYDRLYTIDTAEAQAAVSKYGFTLESTSGFKADSGPSANSTPVYRLLSSKNHFFTRDRDERDNAIMYLGYLGEGIAFYSPISTVPGVKPVHRATHYPSGARLYTASESEKQTAIGTYGFSSEGIGWYGY